MGIPPDNGKKADQGYTPVRLWERPDVRATRVEIKAGAIRAVHQHDDVKFHLFIPLMGTLQLTIGSDKPVDAPIGQAFYIKGGTPHGFRNLGSTPGAVMHSAATRTGFVARRADAGFVMLLFLKRTVLCLYLKYWKD